MTRPEPDRLPDREALRELRALYSHCYDDGRLDDFVALFTDDGLLQLGPSGFARGPSELRAALEGPMKSAAFVAHFTSDEVTRFTGDTTAEGRSRFAVHFGREPNIQGAGTYRDEYVLTDGGWRFAARRIDFFYMGPRPEWPTTPPPPVEG